jgi:2',3'-cyclic-nucleotide 2'-phosphodiesterase
MQKEIAVTRFVRKLPGERLEVAVGEPTICGVVIETDNASGLARGIWPLRLGGKLDAVMPPSQ